MNTIGCESVSFILYVSAVGFGSWCFHMTLLYSMQVCHSCYTVCIWIICRKEKAIMWWSKYTYWFIKKKILFNWFDLFFFLASRWITHDLWSSVSSLFRVSRQDMDYCCMLKKTYLWSGFLIANKTFQIFFILNTCSMTVIENHWKIIIEKLVIIWD